MELSLEKPKNNSIIAIDEKVKLKDKTLEIPCYITNEIYLTENIPNKFEDITFKLIDELITKDKITILIIGTGEKQKFLDPKLQVELSNIGIAVEVMKNASAVYSFNILLAENRNVGLILL